MDFNSHTCQICGRNFPAKLNIVKQVVVDIHAEEVSTDFYVRGKIWCCHHCRRDLRRWMYALIPGMTDRGVGADLKPELSRRPQDRASEAVLTERATDDDVPDMPMDSDELSEVSESVEMMVGSNDADKAPVEIKRKGR